MVRRNGENAGRIRLACVALIPRNARVVGPAHSHHGLAGCISGETSTSFASDKGPIPRVLQSTPCEVPPACLQSDGHGIAHAAAHCRAASLLPTVLRVGSVYVRVGERSSTDLLFKK